MKNASFCLVKTKQDAESCCVGVLLMWLLTVVSIDLLVGLISAHFADGVLEHDVLLEQVVHRHHVLMK